ncbi:hypothetical protein D3C81_1196540 [compost metagenome]
MNHCVLRHVQVQPLLAHLDLRHELLVSGCWCVDSDLCNTLDRSRILPEACFPLEELDFHVRERLFIQPYNKTIEDQWSPDNSHRGCLQVFDGRLVYKRDIADDP